MTNSHLSGIIALNTNPGLVEVDVRASAMMMFELILEIKIMHIMQNQKR